MHKNAELIQRFYTAFNARDGAAMAACYADDASFSDPVFPDLDAAGVRGMWQMLTGQVKDDFKVTVSGIEADDGTGKAHWEAWYTFSTGRKVHNKIDASFRFKDGLIVRHDDVFDFWAWSRMGLGPLGLLLGWTPFLKNKVRAQAGGQLERYLSRS